MWGGGCGVRVRGLILLPNLTDPTGLTLKGHGRNPTLKGLMRW